MKENLLTHDSAAIRADFDEIARLSEQFDGGSARFDALVQSLVPAEAKRVLDVGCGTGRLTVRLMQSQRECVGVDLSPEMIRRAQRDAVAGGPSFVCGDFLELDFGLARFDCIVSAAALHHMSADLAIPRMKQLLEPGGRVIIHDLRASAGLLDELVSWSGPAYQAASRFLRTGWPFAPRALRRAWAKHGARERYLTMHEVNEMAARLLPRARIIQHHFWRYTIVWDKTV
ncbi:MAG: class I SAM-dependent methyltransferase [Gemmatimonadota bacterium]